MIDIAREANRMIVGIGPPPYCVEDRDGDVEWPTEGYDGPLRTYPTDRDSDVLKDSGRPKEDWLQLADVMLARWTEFKAAVEKL